MADNHRMESNPLFTRRDMLGMSGQAALAGIAAGAVSQAADKRPRIACVVTPIGLLRAHMRTGSSPSCWTVIGGRVPILLRGWTWCPCTFINCK